MLDKRLEPILSSDIHKKIPMSVNLRICCEFMTLASKQMVRFFKFRGHEPSKA